MPFTVYPGGGGQLILELDPETVASLQVLTRRIGLGLTPGRTSESGTEVEAVAQACIGTTLYLADQTSDGATVILRPRTGRPRRLLFAWDRGDAETLQSTRRGRARTTGRHWRI